MKALLISAAMALVPLAASALTIGTTTLTTGEGFSQGATFLRSTPPFVTTENDTRTRDDTITFDFIAGEALQVGAILLTAQGTNNGADIARLRFRSTEGPTEFTAFPPPLPLPPGPTGSNPPRTSQVLLEGFELAAGDTFSIDFFRTSAVTRQASVDVTFDVTEIPAAIPLPAGGLLLLGAFGAFGLVGRRRG